MWIHVTRRRGNFLRVGEPYRGRVPSPQRAPEDVLRACPQQQPPASGPHPRVQYVREARVGHVAAGDHGHGGGHAVRGAGRREGRALGEADHARDAQAARRREGYGEHRAGGVSESSRPRSASPYPLPPRVGAAGRFATAGRDGCLDGLQPRTSVPPLCHRSAQSPRTDSDDVSSSLCPDVIGWARRP